jgi:SAM-dependent methyltransferase
MSKIELIEYEGVTYPKFQSLGCSANYTFTFAKEFCKGVGYDIGCNRKEWALEGAIPIDLIFDDPYDAYNLPDGKVDYIFSSHCLEHLPNWVSALEYWDTKIDKDGVIYLYLPHYSQTYWRPWNNKKHIHILQPEIIRNFFEKKSYSNIFVGEKDLNNSFTIVAIK